MAKYTTGGTRKKQKFNKFELVLARKPEGAWWLCKVLQSNDKGKDNFAILFLNTGKMYFPINLDLKLPSKTLENTPRRINRL